MNELLDFSSFKYANKIHNICNLRQTNIKPLQFRGSLVLNGPMHVAVSYGISQMRKPKTFQTTQVACVIHWIFPWIRGDATPYDHKYIKKNKDTVKSDLNDVAWQGRPFAPLGAYI